MLFNYVSKGNISAFKAEVESLKTQGQLSFEKALLQPNAEGQTLLHVAVKTGKIDIVRELLLLGHPLNVADKDGKTPTDLANAASCKEIACLLKFCETWQTPNQTLALGIAFSHIKEAFEKTKRAHGHDLALVVGNTGAGKSTLVNYLLGARYKLRQIKKDFFLELQAGSKEVAPVGKSNAISETLYPQIFPLQNRGAKLALCDLPGFADTRGVEKSICAASGSQILLRQGKRVKTVLLILSYDDLKGSRALEFKRVCLQLNQMLQEKTELIESSVYFVITKAEGYTVDDFYKQYLDELLDHPEEGLIAKRKSKKLSKEDAALHDVLISMRKNPKRILIPNIVDTGDSAEAIFTAVRNNIAHSIGNFSFLNHDESQKRFNEAIFKCLQVYLHYMDWKEKELPDALHKEYLKKATEGKRLKYQEAIDKNNSNILTLTFENANLESTLEKLRSVSLSEPERRVITNTVRKEIVSNIQRINKLKSKNVNLQNNIHLCYENVANIQKAIDCLLLSQKDNIALTNNNIFQDSYNRYCIAADKVSALQDLCQDICNELEINKDFYAKIYEVVELLGLPDDTHHTVQRFKDGFQKRNPLLTKTIFENLRITDNEDENKYAFFTSTRTFSAISKEFSTMGKAGAEKVGEIWKILLSFGGNDN